MKIIAIPLLFTLILSASDISVSNSLTLDEAINILKNENLEIKAAQLDIKAAKADVDAATGNNWGKLDFQYNIARSNDAGNVFGFKLASREATFGDFGFGDPNMPAFGTPGFLVTPPDSLNYPDARNFFQAKLKYEVPLFTGYMLSGYTNIMNAMSKMKTLEKEQLVNEKIYQIKKSFYDMALLQNSTTNLRSILNNIKTLETMTKNMIDVGYAKKVDLLEVQAKKGNVERLINQMHSNETLLYHYISFLLNKQITHITPPKNHAPMPLYTNQEIVESNLDVKRASTGLTIREEMVGVSEAAYYPTVGAFAEVSTADDSFMGAGRQHKGYTIGARLNWNFFNGGIDSAQIEKSKIEHLKTKTQVELARQGIILKVSKIKTEINTFDMEIASLKKELLLANEIYANYEGRYREKLSSMSDVIIKQSEQIQKILQLQMAHNKRNERIFALEKLANGENR